MKYNKDVILDQLESKRLELVEVGNRSYEKARSAWNSALLERSSARSDVEDMLSNLHAIPKQGSAKDLSENERYERIARALTPKRTGGDVYFRMRDLIEAIKKPLPEPDPLTHHQRDRELARVMEVFRTGAPPEVSTTDLRAFGLIDFLRFGGDGQPRGRR